MTGEVVHGELLRLNVVSPKFPSLYPNLHFLLCEDLLGIARKCIMVGFLDMIFNYSLLMPKWGIILSQEGFPAPPNNINEQRKQA